MPLRAQKITTQHIISLCNFLHQFLMTVAGREAVGFFEGISVTEFLVFSYIKVAHWSYVPHAPTPAFARGSGIFLDVFFFHFSSFLLLCYILKSGHISNKQIQIFVFEIISAPGSLELVATDTKIFLQSLRMVLLLF